MSRAFAYHENQVKRYRVQNVKTPPPFDSVQIRCDVDIPLVGCRFVYVIKCSRISADT